MQFTGRFCNADLFQAMHVLTIGSGCWESWNIFTWNSIAGFVYYLLFIVKKIRTDTAPTFVYRSHCNRATSRCPRCGVTTSLLLQNFKMPEITACVLLCRKFTKIYEMNLNSVAIFTIHAVNFANTRRISITVFRHQIAEFNTKFCFSCEKHFKENGHPVKICIWINHFFFLYVCLCGN